MYKVFLADDEIVVREGIRSNFPWEKTDFVLAGEAPDGEIALSMLQDIKPDILITDIRMPFMDGLALCRTVSKTMPWVYIIILSGYDDFAYAREAITLGVKEYMLKPFSSEDLLHALNRLAECIAADKKEQANMRTFRDQIASSSLLLKEKLLCDLLAGMPEADVRLRARTLQMGLDAGRYLTMIVDLNQENASVQKTRVAQSVLCRLADSSGGTVHLCQMQECFVMLVMGDDERDLEERAYGLAQAAQFDMERSTGLKPLVTIGAAVAVLYEVQRSYADARELLKELHAVKGENEARRIVSMLDIEPDSSQAIMELELPPLFERIKHAGRDEIDTILVQYFDSIGETAAQSKLIAHYVYMDILMSASRMIRDCGGEPQIVVPQVLQNIGTTSYTLEQVEHMARELLQGALNFRDQQGSVRYGVVIRKAKGYIDENFNNPDLTLRDIASFVLLSNNHFCTVFSQETGVTFTEYLTALRLTKAKELLQNPALRTSEISLQVGYNDPHYFSYLFRKRFGMSPRDYRKDLTSENIIPLSEKNPHS